MGEMKQATVSIAYSPTNTIRTIDRFYQWDKGVALRLVDFPADAGLSVHFSVDGQTAPALVVEPSLLDGVYTVEIPDEMFAQGKTIKGYVHSEISDDALTIFEIRIPVIPRPRPSDYVYESGGSSGGGEVSGSYIVSIEIVEV